MANYDRDDRENNPLTASTTTGEPPKKLPKGVVLGKDGKPCRSCTSFAAWASQTKDSQKQSSPTKTTTSNSSGAAVGPSIPEDCPPDVETLGRSSWTLLHSIASQYPDCPSTTEQRNVKEFMRLFATLYPCWVCGEGFAKFQAKRPVPTESRGVLGNWLCEAHNEVNRRLGKKEFDCSRWEERWRDGPKGGGCG